jgi:hypothetical protein
MHDFNENGPLDEPDFILKQLLVLLRGRLHGRVVPAKRVDSLCRVDPLPICIVYYFDISITCKAS